MLRNTEEKKKEIQRDYKTQSLFQGVYTIVEEMTISLEIIQHNTGTI